MNLIRKQKLVRTLGFFLEFFSQLILTTGSWEKVSGWVVGGGGGENDSSVISLVKESRLLTFSELNEGDLESTLTTQQSLFELDLNWHSSKIFVDREFSF